MAPSRGTTILRIVHRRAFHYSSRIESGHNRWSKIKHDKGKNDAAKTRQRSLMAGEIATASRLFGPDVNSNPRLGDLIQKAKREGFAKASIEAAVARGQGRSTTGASLETVVIEAIMPNNIGVIMDCETDNKLRTLHEIRHIIKTHGGAATPTGYLFDKRGRTVLDFGDQDAEAALEAAVEAGAIDVEDSDDGLVVLSEPDQTSQVGKAMSEALKVDISSAGVAYIAKPDTITPLPGDEVAHSLGSFVNALTENDPGIQTLAMNIAQGQASDDAYAELQAVLSP